MLGEKYVERFSATPGRLYCAVPSTMGKKWLLRNIFIFFDDSYDI